MEQVSEGRVRQSEPTTETVGGTLEGEPNMGWTEALGPAATNPPTPRRSGNIVEALGKQWTFAKMEWRLKAQFEQWVRAKAKAECSILEREDGPEVGDKAWSTYLNNVSAGAYNWDGRACRKARTDWPGVIYQCFLCIQRCHPEVTEKQVEAIVKDSTISCREALSWALQGNSESPAASQQVTGGSQNGHGAMSQQRTTENQDRGPQQR